jgi:hypothetical protein
MIIFFCGKQAKFGNFALFLHKSFFVFAQAPAMPFPLLYGMLPLIQLLEMADSPPVGAVYEKEDRPGLFRGPGYHGDHPLAEREL